ncbi:hypothetical protein CEXT_463491 [Caerostris extrusa]|uniref:Uncharacterized protein n=1 Tax=Caerostris extrusa TaxID=172846 RepID=A0AAV4PDT1_CAEEX|nr:hypothetical protein CEXT_463491 [Caerostris extrusa]
MKEQEERVPTGTADGALSPERLSICTWSGYVIRDDTCTLTLAPALTLPETDAFIPADWRSFSAPRFVTIRSYRRVLFLSLFFHTF